MEMNPVASSGRVSQEIREKILRRLEAWLDEALTGEESPQGLTAECSGRSKTAGLCRLSRVIATSTLCGAQ